MAVNVERQIWPQYSREVLDRLAGIAAAGNLGAADPHPSVKALEEGFVALLGGGQAAFYNSGTSALLAALFGLQLPRGSEVIVPISTFRSTVTPLLQLGLRPAVAACGEDTLIDPQSVQSLVSPRTSAILVNHQWGMPADMVAIGDIARSRGLAVVEDCSHSHGSSMAAGHVGTFGDVAFFSCGTTKMVTGGLGGVLWSRRPEIYQRAICLGLAKHVVAPKLSDSSLSEVASVGLGLNLRGHPLAAELALSHLTALPQTVARKNRNLELLDEMIGRHFPETTPLPRPARWNQGTWYKRPYLLPNQSAAERVIRIGKAAGLRLEASAPNTDVLLERLIANLPQSLPNAAIDASYVVPHDKTGWDFRSVVFHDTRDMYFDVEWGRLEEGMATELAREKT